MYRHIQEEVDAFMEVVIAPDFFRNSAPKKLMALQR
jgi:hypothetical protein